MVVTEIAGQAVEAAKGDFLTIKGEVFRQVKDPETDKIFLVPVEVEAHVNPASILTGVAAALAGVVFGTIAWHGLSLPGPTGPITLFKGLKETTMGADLNRAYERAMIKRRIKASGGDVVDSRSGLTQAEKDEVLLQAIGDDECRLFNREWVRAKRGGRPDDAASWLQQAKDRDCPWAGGR